ncbi:MAG: hypothetical protein ACT4NY_25725 [Pseudonocardiales bacterium]
MTGATRAILVQTMVDARTLTEHLIDLNTLAAARSHGRYTALCGAEVLAASMITEESRFCQVCIRRQVDRWPLSPISAGQGLQPVVKVDVRH